VQVAPRARTACSGVMGGPWAKQKEQANESRRMWFERESRIGGATPGNTQWAVARSSPIMHACIHDQ
jgi:hypothetical protein